MFSVARESKVPFAFSCAAIFVEKVTKISAREMVN
jgi:hypothetical protein